VTPGKLKSSPTGKAPFQLKITDQMAERLRRMHPLLKRKIKVSLSIILMDPGEGKALKEELAGLHSFRVSRFRIVYRVKNRVVEIIAVGPRDRIYQETFQILKKRSSE